MAAHLSYKMKTERERSVETRLGASVKRKRMSRPRKRISCAEGRDFFRLAAAFANADRRESDFASLAKAAPRDALAELASSKLLQARYQERSHLFVGTSSLSLSSELSSLSDRVWQKWQQAHGVGAPEVNRLLLQMPSEDEPERPWLKNGLIKNGVRFSARESAYLVALAENLLVDAYLAKHSLIAPPCLTAPAFHRLFTKCIEQKLRSFICVATTVNAEEKMSVERARLFWSHRLRTKAWQATNGAESSICYFHAALRSKTAPFEVDFLYWLKLDDEKVILDGDFISLADSSVCPIDLFFAEMLLFETERFNTCLAALDLLSKLFVLEVKSLLSE
jgi:hypothetical protein